MNRPSHAEILAYTMARQAATERYQHAKRQRSENPKEIRDMHDKPSVRLVEEKPTFVPKRWPWAPSVVEKRHHEVPADELKLLLGDARRANETHESMATRLDAGYRNLLRREARRGNPQQRLCGQIDAFVALLRTHEAWVDEHFTHKLHRSNTLAEGAERHHIATLLADRAEVCAVRLDPFCTSHDAFVSDVARASETLNDISRRVLTKLQSIQKRASGTNTPNAALANDIEHTFPPKTTTSLALEKTFAPYQH